MGTGSGGWTAEATLARWRRAVPSNCKIAFWTAFLLGLAIHIYNLTNLLPNHDTVLSLFSSGSTVASGRWFLPVVGHIGSTFSIHWANGVLAMAALALTAALTVSLLEIRRPLFAALAAAAMVASPAVSNTFCYLFTVDAYFCGAAMAALGVWLTDRHGWGILPGGLLLAFAAATYQVYLFFALALMAARGLLLLFSGERADGAVGRLAGRYALTFGAGIVFYAAGLATILRLTGVSMVAYQGIGEASFQIGTLLAAVPAAYRSFFAFFFSETRELATAALCLVHAGILLGSAALSVWLLAARKRTRLQTVLAAALMLLMPMFLNAAFLLPASTFHILMHFPIVLVYILPLSLCELSGRSEQAAPFPALLRAFPRLMGWCMAAALLFSTAVWANYANKLYLQLQLKYENSFALAARIVDRIEQDEDYTPGMTVVFAGSLLEGSYPLSKESAYVSLGFGVGGGGPSDFTLIHDEEHMHPFARYFIGVQFAQLSPEAAKAVSETDAVRDMPSYPTDGSIRLHDGVLVVKLGN